MLKKMLKVKLKNFTTNISKKSTSFSLLKKKKFSPFNTLPLGNSPFIPYRSERDAIYPCYRVFINSGNAEAMYRVHAICKFILDLQL